MQLSVVMDPMNPRWQTSEERTRRSATIWKIIVGAAGASALSAAIVASCLGRDEARRDLEEPAYVETTSAGTTTTTTGAPTTRTTATTGATTTTAPRTPTQDSTGGIAPTSAADDGSRSTDGADVAGAAPVPRSATTITSAPIAPRNYTPVPVTFERANGDSSTSGTAGTTNNTNVHTAGPNAGVNGSNVNPPTNGGTDATWSTADAGPTAGHASHANNDPNNRGSNPESPPMSSGAGRFITEAPYWSGSAWTSDPNAGAGPFETERNTPAH